MFNTIHTHNSIIWLLVVFVTFRYLLHFVSVLGAFVARVKNENIFYSLEQIEAYGNRFRCMLLLYLNSNLKQWASTKKIPNERTNERKNRQVKRMNITSSKTERRKFLMENFVEKENMRCNWYTHTYMLWLSK